MNSCKPDFSLLFEALIFVWDKKLSFIFPLKTLLEKICVLMFDENNFYLFSSLLINKEMPFSRRNKYFIYRFPHKISFKEQDFAGWQAGIPSKLLIYLPEEVQKMVPFPYQVIFGSVPDLFLQYHKKNNTLYRSREGFLATVIHEFGHAYWNLHKLWWFSDKKQNIKYIETAIKLFKRQNVQLDGLNIGVPFPVFWSEVFAFCAEYQATNIFWPDYAKQVEEFFAHRLEESFSIEMAKDLDKENSLFDGDKNVHLAAATLGRIIYQKYPHLWPQVLLNRLGL